MDAFPNKPRSRKKKAAKSGEGSSQAGTEAEVIDIEAGVGSASKGIEEAEDLEGADVKAAKKLRDLNVEERAVAIAVRSKITTRLVVEDAFPNGETVLEWAGYEFQRVLDEFAEKEKSTEGEFPSAPGRIH